MSVKIVKVNICPICGNELPLFIKGDGLVCKYCGSKVMKSDVVKENVKYDNH